MQHNTTGNENISKNRKSSFAQDRTQDLCHEDAPEGGADVVVLQHAAVVVEEGGVGTGVDVEAVGGAGVFYIMHHGRQQKRQHFQVGEKSLKRRMTLSRVYHSQNYSNPVRSIPDAFQTTPSQFVSATRLSIQIRFTSENIITL